MEEEKLTQELKSLFDDYKDYGYGEWEGIPKEAIPYLIEGIVEVIIREITELNN